MISLSIDGFVVITFIIAVTLRFAMIKLIQYLENKSAKTEQSKDDCY